MRRLILILCAVALVAGPVFGSTYKRLETIAVAGTAVGLSATTISPSGYPQMRQCVGRLETAEIRFRYDGTDPTSAVGQLLEPLEILTLSDFTDISQLKMIRTTSTSASITFVCSAP